MSESLPKFTLRVPQELLDKIKVLADENGRSINKEIEQILKEHLKNKP